MTNNIIFYNRYVYNLAVNITVRLYTIYMFDLFYEI